MAPRGMMVDGQPDHRRPMIASPARDVSALAVKQVSLSPRGGRRMRFAAREVALARGQAGDGAVWHEIALYLRERAGVVLALRCVFRDSRDAPVLQALRFDTLEDALAALQDYDAGADVPVAEAPPEAQPCPAEMAAAALDLRAQVEMTRRRFADLRTEVYDRLDMLGLI